jgi:hypothetical protein
MKKINSRIIFILMGVILLLLASCGPSEEELRATDTKIAEEVFATQTAAASTATNTNTPGPTFTPSLKPSEKKAATAQSGTATAIVRATSQAQPMADLVHQLYEDNYIGSTQGKYIRLNDYEESFAQINWVTPRFTDITLSNFVLRSNIAWKTAKEGANIRYSGCGFWFGVDQDVENFHEVMLALDGNVRFNRCLNDCSYMSPLASSFFGKIDYMEGNADVILIVEGGTIQYFVDGEQIFIRRDQKKLTGYLAYAISSGTNADFGTRCIFTDTEIWSLDK